MKTTCKTIGGIFALALSTGALASDYSFEIGGNYLDLDGTTVLGADASIYFQPVRTEQGPYGEAAFLNRASNVSFTYLREKGGDFDMPSVRGEFYFGNFYLAAQYARFSNAFSLDDYAVQVGMMLGESTRLTVGYEHVDLPFNMDFDIYTVGAKHVMSLAGDSALNLEGDVGVARNGGDNFFYNLRADYYFNRAFSLGARYSGIESDDEWGLGARFFFTPRISGGVEYARANGDDLFSLRVAARF